MINMNRRRSRQIIFICAASQDNQLVIRMVPADNPQQASDLFLEQTQITAQEVLGPFYKKKTQVIEHTRSLKFVGQTKSAVYNGWKVDAFLLHDPRDHAYLVFHNRVDDKKISAPHGTVVVPVSQLEFTSNVK